MALLEGTESTWPPSRLRLVDLVSGADVYAYDLDGSIGTIGFQPNASGVVFVESRTSNPTQLRYLSADQSILLGEWQTTQFQYGSLSDYYGTPLYTYPVDPTGCFTVFDTDLPPRPGTGLAILPQ